MSYVHKIYSLLMKKNGVLPKQVLRSLFKKGYITGVDEKYINPASIDLPLSEEAYRLESIFLPLHGEKVRDLLPMVGARPHSLAEPLEVGVPYLIRVSGAWKLPDNVYGYANPKSSSGRLGFFCRVVADRVDRYDSLIDSGWGGEMWILARTDYFPVIVSPGLAIAQVRLIEGRAILDRKQSEAEIKKEGLVFDSSSKKILPNQIRWQTNSLMLTLQVDKTMGWECRGTHKILNLGNIGHYKPNDFFKAVRPTKNGYLLRKRNFYIFSTKENVSVPPHLSAELRAIDPRLGEFRSHAAGYIDPGWGYGKTGNVHGRPITLEVIPQEDMLVRDGQTIARIRYEYMKDVPETIYDVAKSNYVNQQSAKLSKHFKLPK